MSMGHFLKTADSLISPIAVVCHDAGAANLIFAWLRSWHDSGVLLDCQFNFFLQGPAEKLWLNNPVPLPILTLNTSIETAMNRCKTVLTGTGWGSGIEHQARRLALQMQVPSIAVIDHWVNYPERFVQDGISILPSEIWVSDENAFDLAKGYFLNTPIVQLPNLYLQHLVMKIPKVSENCRKLLYVLEPVRDEWGKSTPGELQALDFFLNRWPDKVDLESISILLRPHPSESSDKYNDWLTQHQHLNIEIDSCRDLNESIASAKWVVGVESYALVVAEAAGRLVYSSKPPWAGRCRLPLKNLTHLQDLL